MKLVNVRIDNREPDSLSQALLRAINAKHPNIPITINRLEYGDIQWTVEQADLETITYIVERKTLNDLSHSINDQRWQRQTAALAEFINEYPSVIGIAYIEVNHRIDFTYKYTLGFYVHPSALMTISLTQMVVNGLPTVIGFVLDTASSADNILRMIDWSLRSTHNSIKLKNKQKTARPYLYKHHRERVLALMTLPRFTEDMARVMLDAHDQSVLAVMQTIASDTRLTVALTGVTEYMAKKWKEFLNGNR